MTSQILKATTGSAALARVLSGFDAALGPARSAKSGPAIHSPLTGNDVVVGAAKDALIQVIQPGVHPYVAAGDAGFKEEAATLGLTKLQITQSNFDPATEVASRTRSRRARRRSLSRP